MRNTDSNCRLCRREGDKLFLKGARCYTEKCALERRPYPPGQHGQKRQKRSDYAIQLREKQKLKRIYGLQDVQMFNTFERAHKMEGVTGENLVVLLERRLDNVVYRMGIAASRKEARQLVDHGHFTINGQKATIPSMLIKKGDIVEVKRPSRDSSKIKTGFEANSMREIPAWLDVDKNNLKATVKDLPKREDVTAAIEERLVVELYGR